MKDKMTQTEARQYIADQIGVDVIKLCALLETFAPASLTDWLYIADQLGQPSPKELRDGCIRHGAYTVPYGLPTLASMNT